MKVRPLAPEDADQDPDAAPVYSKDDAERLRLGSHEHEALGGRALPKRVGRLNLRFDAENELLFDRREVYRILEEVGVPVPIYTVHNADAATPSGRARPTGSGSCCYAGG